MKLIQGAKGGGKSGGGSAHVPTEADDTLKSRSYAKVLDLICEGPVKGLVKPGLQSVFLDDTPIENEDGSFNFTGVDFAFREGTQHQDYIPAFPQVERERVVNVEVKKDQPIIETVDDLDIDAVRVKVAVPRLSRQKENGDIVGHKVSYAIETKENGGTWVERIADTMSGKSSGRYEREYAVTLEGAGPWQVRVVRTSKDDTKSSEQSNTYFASMTEVILAKLSYPNSVLAGLIVDSSQFSKVPTRSYELFGTEVRVPVNYDPDTREYTGIWDGTFKQSWTSNPAWIFYDLMIESRYGLGKYLSEFDVDKWRLYQIAQYCDELVDDGFGGFEPRYQLNGEIRGAKQAMQVINEVISCFRAMPFWDGQQVILSQDSQKDPTARFTNANVKEGKFSYQGTSRTARHTVALVEWINPENGYESEIEYVEDEEGIKRYGYNQIQVAAFGCTSRGQANRVGRWILLTERLETDTITFVSGLSGTGLMPGDVIEIADENRMGARWGGRILGVDANSLTLDAPITIQSGETYSVAVELPDGNYAKRTLNNAAGETDVLTFNEALPTELPQDYAIWVAMSQTLQTSLWRVMSAADKEGELVITAVEHHPGKHDAVELGVQLESRNTTRSRKPSVPVNLDLTEQLFESAGRVLNSIELVCDSHLDANLYQFGYSYEGEAWVDMPLGGHPSQIVRDIEPGDYRIRARVKSPFGDYSPWSYSQKLVQGKTAPPANVQGLRGRVVGDQFRLSWDKAVDLDVLIGGQVQIRHARTGAIWNAAADIGESVSGSATSTSVPLLDGSYLVKFVDSSGKPSNDSAVITTNVAAAYARNVVAEVEHGPVFDGTAVGLTASGDQLLLDVDGSGYLLAASYTFDGPDLGAAYVSRVSLSLLMQIYKSGDLFDERPDLVDDWDDWDNMPDGSNIDLQFQYTTGDPNDAESEWTEWEPFLVGDYFVRATRFRAVYTSVDSNNVFSISSAKAVIDMPDAIDAQSNILCPAEGTRVEYQLNYFGGVGPPAITQVDPQTGDYFQLSNEDKSGFDIRFFNASGTAVARLFNYFNKGY